MPITLTPEACDNFFERNYSRLLALSANITRQSEVCGSGSLLHNVWLRLRGAKVPVDPQRGLTGLVVQHLNWELFNQFRKRKPWCDLDQTPEPIDGSIEASLQIQNDEDLRCLAQALAKLRKKNERLAQIIHLRFLEEMTVPTIAATMDLGETTVKSDIQRGLVLLRKSLAVPTQAK